MKKRTVLSLTTAAVILAAYVPNEPILADTPSLEVIKETKVGSIIKQNNIKYKVLTVEGNIGTVQVGNGVTPVQFEAGQDGKSFTIPTNLRNTNICDTNQCQYNLWVNWLVHKIV